jgi:hypothetical protein
MVDDVIIKRYNDGSYWYEIYESGLLRQGKKFYASEPQTSITLPINYNDMEYEISASQPVYCNPYKLSATKRVNVYTDTGYTPYKENEKPTFSNEILNKSQFKIFSDYDSGSFEWFSRGYLDVNTYTLTINVTPSDAKVVINGIERTTYTGAGGMKVNYTISKPDYDTIKSSIILTDDTVLNIEMALTSAYTLTIVPGPFDSTVIMNGQERKKIKLPIGEVVDWEVSKEGFVTERGQTIISDSDETLTVNLSKEITITIEAMPDDALILFVGDE